MSYDPQDRAQSVRVGARLDLCDFKASFRLMSGQSQAGGKLRVKEPCALLKMEILVPRMCTKTKTPASGITERFYFSPALKIQLCFSHADGATRTGG